jgi:hypothetical protein
MLFYVNPKTKRHCEERSNLYAVQRKFANLTCLGRDCFVPRNDGRFILNKLCNFYN